MKAEQVLDMQVDLLRRFDDPMFRQVALNTIAPAQSDSRRQAARRDRQGVRPSEMRRAR